MLSWTRSCLEMRAPMQRAKMRILNLFSLILLAAAFAGTKTLAQTTPQRALFLSGDHTLQGFVYKPQGNGPFPVILFNQAYADASKNHGADSFAPLAKVFVNRGYVFFVPGRHAVVENEDFLKLSKDARNVKGHEYHAANISAALKWLVTQVYVDEGRIYLMGDMAGAVSTLFMAESNPSISGMILFSPGTQALRESPTVRNRLKASIQNSTAPIFLIQAENEQTLLPSQILGPELEKKGGFNRVKVFPPYGDSVTEAHKFAMEGSAVWQRDVFSFLQQTSQKFGANIDTNKEPPTSKPSL